MIAQKFEVTINATPEKVWDVLWNDLTYTQWTSVFCHGSYAVSDWKEGSRVHFYSPGGKGMYSNIIALKPNVEMTFNHLGEIDDYKELPNDEKASEWSNSKEQYLLNEINGSTHLVVNLNSVEEYATYFEDVFPKALAIVKELSERNCITITTKINAPIEKVWNYWNEPEHITKWCAASDDWHTPKAANNCITGGQFTNTMAAKDGSFSFEFSGTYTAVKPNELLAYTLEDGRIVRIIFVPIKDQIQIIETFEAETQNPMEMQQTGWQNILDNFKKYVANN